MKLLLSSFLFLSHCCAADAALIDSLPEDRWSEYRDLRLMALEAHPDIFGIKVEDESLKSPEQWKENLRLAQQKKVHWLVFAEQDGKLIGMVGAIKEYANCSYWSHIVTIISVYVLPEYQRQGVATMMFNRLFQLLANEIGVDTAILWVSPASSAYPLYQKLGFRMVGNVERAIKIGDRFFDNYIMQRHIR